MPHRKQLRRQPRRHEKVAKISRNLAIVGGENRSKLRDVVRFRRARTLLPNRNLEALAPRYQFAAKHRQEPCATRGCL